MWRALVFAAALLAWSPAFAQTNPQAHGIFDTAPAANGAQLNPGASAGVTVFPSIRPIVETNTAIGTTATNFGTPGPSSLVFLQAQGQPMCVTFGTGTLAAPSGTTCAVGLYMAAGATYLYPTTGTPSTQGRAIAATTGGTMYEQVMP